MADKPSVHTDANSLPPFDLAAALQVLGNRRHVLVELARLFVRSRSALVESVEQALHTGDPDQVERSIHALRGAIGYFRAGPLWALTDAMRHAASSRDLEALRRRLPEFRAVVEDLANALKELFADEPPAT